MSTENKRRHLIVSFNFHPRQGSEEAVGWVFSRISAESAETVVYTQASYREKIGAGDEKGFPSNLEVRYFRPKWLPEWAKSRLLPVSLYYKLWHLGLYHHLRGVIKEEHFSLCHVCTWVSAIHPVASLLLPLPVIWGPLGGVATPPFGFYDSHGWRWRLREALRLISIRFAPFGPLLRKVFAKGDLILAAADDCRDWIVEKGLSKASRVRVIPAITFPEQATAKLNVDTAESTGLEKEPPLRMISAARLLPWKGMDLLLHAIAQSGRKNLLLQIFGEGSDRSRLEALTQELGLVDLVTFKGLVDRESLLQAMASSDLFALPSLHDSEAGACMEASGLGVPVVALDYGGAKSCLRGCRETTFLPGRTRDEAIKELAEYLISAERVPRNGNRIGNIPEDSLLLYVNKKNTMKEWYKEATSSSAKENN